MGLVSSHGPVLGTIFQVVAHSFGGHAVLNWSWQVATLPEALESSIAQLPAGWVSGIEVTDEETNIPDEMPLIDYWKES